MSEDLLNEIEAINAIYGEGTLEVTEEASIYILRIPARTTSVKLIFPEQYPEAAPRVSGVHSAGDTKQKGKATQTLDLVSQKILDVYRPGEVCLFDLLEELETLLETPQEKGLLSENDSGGSHTDDFTDSKDDCAQDSLPEPNPQWSVSEIVTEKKSVFVARAATVSSKEQAEQYVNYLFSIDKKVAKATHNITAWRIKGNGEVIYQDSDDDGEDAAGGRLLHLMKLMDLWNVMVVVTRWYGGIKLGPDR
ncbi:MAG: eIF2 kinase Gcn2p negative regulator [Vezdaea acicularis]|nr:MAG: eIF2 kinase Gcn2p negative regulator [Vezdaea acicularis]